MRPRGSLIYDKPPLDLDDLVDRFLDRGLRIADSERARRYLQHIGYYRLSPYAIDVESRTMIALHSVPAGSVRASLLRGYDVR